MDETPSLDPIPLSAAAARVLAKLDKQCGEYADTEPNAANGNGQADTDRDAPEVSHQASPSC